MTESTANYTQVVIAGLTFLVFVGLALITLHYAWQTKRMADIMTKEFEVRSRPLVDVRVGLPYMTDDSVIGIPLETILLGEFPFMLTRTELEVELPLKSETKMLRMSASIDVALTKGTPILKKCTGPFEHQSIRSHMEKRKKDATLREPRPVGLYIYHRNIVEDQEELFQKLPVPYRNHFELDDICGRDSGVIRAFGQRDAGDLGDF